MDYSTFIASRRPAPQLVGFEPAGQLNAALFPHQRDCVEFACRVGRAALFLDCVAGETKIDTIAGPRRIDALARAGRPIIVRALAEDGTVRLALATAPFCKGHARLYRVETAGGRSMVTTAGHRFLSDRGWIACGELSAGTRLRVTDACHPPTNQELDLSRSRPDDLHCGQTREDLTDHCSPCSHRYDPPLRPGGGSDPVAAPSPAYALSRGLPWSHEDDLAHGSAHNRLRPNSARPSTLDLARQDCCAADGLEFQPPAYGSAQVVESTHTAQPTASAAIQRQSSIAVHQEESQSFEGAPYSAPAFDTVVSIKYLRTDFYYDLHVPGHENYAAHGFWSHNTGLGKSLCALEWARQVVERTGLPVIILTPLAVAAQFVREGARFGIPCRQAREGIEIAGPGVYVANYERLGHLDGIEFGGVVLDESSILKAFAGRTRQALTARFATTPYRLCCTATPAPNDHMELGNHAEFLGVMQSIDMLQRWFINETETASQSWRLKGHAVEDFWDWVCSWARCVSSPADLGYDDSAYRLPELREIPHEVATDITADAGDTLFRISGVSASNLHKEQRLSLPARVERIAWLTKAEAAEPWLIWCETDEQADALVAAIPDAVEVRGSHPAEWKEDRLLAFAEGRARVLVTKARIAGFGLNFQHCARMAFVALTFSYEAYYQAIRRCWRFGQTRPVHAHLISSDGEAAIFGAVRRKAEQHDTMKTEMQAAVRRAQAKARTTRRAYLPTHAAPLPKWVRTAA